MTNAQPHSQDRGHGPDKIPIVSRVFGDTIVELVYDAERVETALAVSRFAGLWNLEREFIHAGETYIPYSARNNLIRTGCVLLPSKPEHHGDKAQLLKDIESYLNRYIDLSPTFVRLAAHYVLLSWVFDAFNELPYLRLRGDFGTGKTRGLITIGSILYKPFFASGASTVSPIFHILDTVGGSLVLDEADFSFSDATSELVKILNNGTMRGLPVLRTLQNQHRELNPRAFRVFGPKIVAMRDGFDDRGLESRLITANMNERRIRDDIPIHLPRELSEEALTLRNRLLHFRFVSRFLIRVDPSFAIPDADSRVNQMALPILSIVDDLDERAAFGKLFIAQSDRLGLSRVRLVVAKIVEILTRSFQSTDVSAVAIGDITREVNAGLPERQYTYKQIGFIVRSTLKLRTQKSNGVFVVTRDELPEIEARASRLGIQLPPKPEAEEPPADDESS